MAEFDVIARYFMPVMPTGVIGGGDDCAYFSVSPQHQLATSADLLLEGRHFFHDVNPYLLGRKALAVNLSDLAAAGARPKACLLSIGLPSIDEAWIAAFSKGFIEHSHAYQCPLVGGDTTRSTQGVVIGVTVLGEVPTQQALLRSQAQTQDDIWVTGRLGGADLALRYLDGRLPMDMARLTATRGDLEDPLPPVRFGSALAGVAHAAIDISDGLLQDLAHILRASQKGAVLWYDTLPTHPALQGLPIAVQHEAVLAGGDVFQLCFTAAPQQRSTLLALAQRHHVMLHRVGEITALPGLRVTDAAGHTIQLSRHGFDHFA